MCNFNKTLGINNSDNNKQIYMKSLLIYLTSFLLLISCNGQTTNSVTFGAKNYVAKHHNKLDDINSATVIETLLTSINKDYNNFKVNSSLTFNDRFGSKADKESQHLADSLKIKAWTKDDFDGNGYTDLLIVGNWYSNHSIICILDSGENKFFIKRITRRSFQDCTFP